MQESQCLLNSFFTGLILSYCKYDYSQFVLMEMRNEGFRMTASVFSLFRVTIHNTMKVQVNV